MSTAKKTPTRGEAPRAKKGLTVRVRTGRATSEPAPVTDSEAAFGAFLDALAEEGLDDLEDEGEPAPDRGP